MAHLHFCQHTKPNNKCKKTTKAAQSGRTNERILAFLQGGLSEDMNQRIRDMLNALRDQLSVKISRIKKAFTDAIGTSLADWYIIQGPNSERKSIKLNRTLIKYQ